MSSALSNTGSKTYKQSNDLKLIEIGGENMCRRHLTENGTVFLSVCKTHRIENNVGMNMLTVYVGCYNTFEVPEGFFRKFNCNLMRKLRKNIITFREGLD